MFTKRNTFRDNVLDKMPQKCELSYNNVSVRNMFFVHLTLYDIDKKFYDTNKNIILFEKLTWHIYVHDLLTEDKLFELSISNSELETIDNETNLKINSFLFEDTDTLEIKKRNNIKKIKKKLLTENICGEYVFKQIDHLLIKAYRIIAYI